MPNDQVLSDSIAASARAALSTVEPRPGVPKPDPIMVVKRHRNAPPALSKFNRPKPGGRSAQYLDFFFP